MEETYTLKDLVTGTFKLASADDIARIEEVEALNLKSVKGRTKAYVHVGLFNYLFNDNLKEAIGQKIRTDLPGVSYRFRM